MVVNNKIEIGDFAYLKTDEDQKKRICTGIMVRQNGTLYYELCCGDHSSEHFDIEFSQTPDINMKLNIPDND